MPDHAALVTALILDRPTCRECLILKSGLSAPDLDATLTLVQTVVRVHSATDRCRVCGAVTTVLSTSRLAHSRMVSGRPPKVRHAVLAFLARHRGQVFCVECVAAAVQASSADLAIREIEGHGVRRRQGRCARCGRARLVSGLAGPSPSLEPD